MRNKSDIVIPYRIYRADGKLEVTSDERCRFPPATELSLLEAGRKIMLGTKKITKEEVLALLKEQEAKGANKNPRNRPRK